ncbi:MAG TPA: hypothetical protein VNH41_01380 [Steroidobacteraceae bacterium]|nr:hypothetical protein [Steroidobacteraceae bacterium]
MYRLLGPALVLVAAMSLAGTAQAGFQVGIVDPNPVPAQDASALGLSWQRLDLIWHGETNYEGALPTAPWLSTVVAVYGYASDVPTTPAELAAYASFIGSILDQFPQVRGIIVWNEASQYAHLFWPDGLPLSNYSAILRAVRPVVHAHGALLIGPGMHPMVPAGAGRSIIQAVADGGGVDVFDMHVYWASVSDMVNVVHSILGGVPIWVTEDGGPDPAQAMRAAYCAGVSIWFNFLLRDAGNWQTGLELDDGTPKPVYNQLAQASSQLRRDGYTCPSSPSVPPPRAVYPLSAGESTVGFPHRWPLR